METEELIELQVSGMHCNNCALSVHKLLEKKGLQDIYVDFANDEVKFKTSDRTVTPAIIKGRRVRLYQRKYPCCCFPSGRSHDA